MGDEPASLKKKAAKGAAWVMLEQLCVQGFNFGLGVVLARLLTPEDYGSVALVMVFITVAQTLVASGLGQALVQKKDADDLDFTTVFFLSLGVATLLYVVLFCAAPFVAAFYKIDELGLVLRILALNLILFAVNSVQSAELFREMRFDVSFRISLVTSLASAVVGLSLAFGGFGVWALVWSSVLSNASGVVARWFFIRWRPRLAFSAARLKPLYRFGWKLMASSLIYASLNNLYGVLIGRFYSRADLAFVNKGRNLPDLCKNNLNVALTESSFPALARMQDEPDRLLEAVRRLMAINVFVVFPTMMFLLLVSRDLILFLYGPQWEPCVVYMQIACAGAALAALGGVHNVAALSVGLSGLLLKVVVFRSILAIAVLCACLSHSVLLWVAIDSVVGVFVALTVYPWIGKSRIGYRYRMQLADVLPTMLLFAAVSAPVWAIGLVVPGEGFWSLFARLALRAVLAATLFLGGAFLLRLRALREISSLVSPRIESWFPAWSRVSRRLR